MNTEPLAYRMRPNNLNEVVGQEHLLGENSFLSTMIAQNKIQPMILYGPPGIGKTSIAYAIANQLNYPYEKYNAAIDDKAKLRKLINAHTEPFILILDEIHRLDKGKQDFLLPNLEVGKIILIGATTENPYITIAPAIRSRSHVLQLKPISLDSITTALKRAWTSNRGLNAKQELDSTCAQLIAQGANGDLRIALNILESAYNVYREKLTPETTKLFLQEQNFTFDKNGDFHYDTISAFQKSIRGSDTDAALYYLGVLCLSDDMDIITRRLSVIAYEDIGLADMQACTNTMQAIACAKQVGLPEARIPLADAVISLCLAPKSNSGYNAINAAIEDAQQNQQHPIPNHLRDAHYKGAVKLGHGTDYIYPHDYPYDFIPQQYLPTDLVNRHYYQAKNNAAEKTLNQRYQLLRQQLYPHY